jgi:hypothetical protein
MLPVLERGSTHCHSWCNTPEAMFMRAMRLIRLPATQPTSAAILA